MASPSASSSSLRSVSPVGGERAEEYGIWHGRQGRGARLPTDSYSGQRDQHPTAPLFPSRHHDYLSVPRGMGGARSQQSQVATRIATIIFGIALAAVTVVAILNYPAATSEFFIVFGSAAGLSLASLAASSVKEQRHRMMGIDSF